MDAEITELCAKELNISADKYEGGAELFGKKKNFFFHYIVKTIKSKSL